MKFPLSHLHYITGTRVARLTIVLLAGLMLTGSVNNALRPAKAAASGKFGFIASPDIGQLTKQESLRASLMVDEKAAISAQSAQLIVSNGNDSGSGSLRDAIAVAASGDTIVFGGVATVRLTSGELAINKNLTINGGSGVTVTRSGTTQFRIFTINSGTVAFNNLTITNGNNPTQAGGVQNYGTLTMTDCTVNGNNSPQGGGVQNDGVMTLTNCTLSNNSAYGRNGGGLIVFGTSTTLTNCTISNNSAASGGGIYITSGSLNLNNCTIANNQASYGSGLAVANNSVSALLKNTIVADNSVENILGTLSPTSSYNLIGTGATGGLTNGVNGNQVGVANPLLGMLVNNGGPTQTIALLPGSPALDQGAAVSGMTTDQRGKSRPYDIPSIPPAQGGNNSDIGAYEAQAGCNLITLSPASLPGGTVGASYSQTITASGGMAPYTFVIASGSLPPGLSLQANGTLSGVATTAGTYNFTVNANSLTECRGSQAYSITETDPPSTLTVTNGNDSGAGSLRDAISAAFSGNTIVFSGVTTVTLTKQELTVNKDLTIDGGNSGVTITRQSGTHGRIFNITAGVTVALNNLAITKGNAPLLGGGILNNGTLTMNNCTVSGNTASQGGGIQNRFVLTLTNCTLSNNSAPKGSGGALFNMSRSATLTNCTISDNSAKENGGGIFKLRGSLNLTNCTIANNQAFAGGGLMTVGTDPVVLQNTIIASNHLKLAKAKAGKSPAASKKTVANGNRIPHRLPENLFGNVDPSSSYNLIGRGTTGGLTNGVNGNQVGIANPLLGVLANYGGYTQTIALLPGSPALDQGAAVPGMTTDQRGLPRPYDISSIPPAAGGNNSDIGAYEAQADCSTVTLAPTSLPSGTMGTSYSQTITASGGTVPYTFIIVSGSLPPGLSLLGDGTLSGVPSLYGTYNFTVLATYGNNCTGSQAYSLSINSQN